MKIGICGGTFDPFHRGHLEPVVAVRAEMEWDRVVYVPAFVQPFKQDRRSASAYHRFAMAVLSTEDQELFVVSPRELERGEISFTVDTLEELRREQPEATIDWIIGDDNLPDLHRWKSVDRIFELANFAVLSRAPRDAAALAPELRGRLLDTPGARARGGAIVLAHNPTVPISATEVRRRVAAGEPFADLVVPRVSGYIERYGLYRKGNS
jgi:nicotinate-nucleotide adenylyltransferase